MADKTCIMTGRATFHGDHFTCSECGKTGNGTWKFCAYCGSEIVRFVREEGPITVQVQVEVPKEKPKPRTIRVKVTKGPTLPKQRNFVSVEVAPNHYAVSGKKKK
jgi:hypothetical protein